MMMRPGDVCELGLEVWGSKRRVAQPYCLKVGMDDKVGLSAISDPAQEVINSGQL